MSNHTFKSFSIHSSDAPESFVDQCFEEARLTSPKPKCWQDIKRCTKIIMNKVKASLEEAGYTVTCLPYTEYIDTKIKPNWE